MDPNWAEITQAVAEVITAITAVGGVIFVVKQLQSVERATRGATYERLAAQSYDVIRFLAQRPQTYKYFYENAEFPDGDDAQDNELRQFVQYATEMLANYCEYVALQKRHMARDTWDSWRSFIEATYECSPLLREFMRREERWYASELIQIFRDIDARNKR